MKGSYYFVIFLLVFFFISCNQTEQKDKSAINHSMRPWHENPFYWQYKGNPVLLLGATDNDNLFQNNNLQTHLDSLQSIGGNYVRNTMSDRDEGDVKAFATNAEGKYDLNQWNNDYWERFENLLKWSQEKDIIVQIEVWDRFDHSRDEWLADPYNPKNNVNYTYEESSLDSLYPNHPGSNEQPFFFTVPALEDNQVVLPYQEAFVKKMLSISLEYDNVLYCIDNETKGMEEWATFWAEFIHENSGDKQVYLTQMWDDWDVKSDMHKRTLDHPERYQFVDLAQNSHNTGQTNWDNARYVMDYIKDHPRPVNSTKIYGSDQGPWLDRGITSEHAVHTFFRNVLGGFASSRFHRPPAGLGLSPPSINSIKSIREIEEKVKMWEMVPRMELLSEVDENEAYLAAKEGEKYVVFFPKGGEVNLDLRSYQGDFEMDWLDIADASWKDSESVSGGELLTIQTPMTTGSVAVIIKK